MHPLPPPTLPPDRPGPDLPSPGIRLSRLPRPISFVDGGGLGVWFLDGRTLSRAFELMVRYANLPMDLADASLVAVAERLEVRKIFIIDRTDFRVYRIRRGYRHLAFDVFE